MSTNFTASNVLQELKGLRDDAIIKISGMQKQIDAIDLRTKDRLTSGPAGPGFSADLEVKLNENDSIQRLLADKKGTAIITLPAHLLEHKTAITSAAAGVATSGVLNIERASGIVPEARQVLQLRNLLTARPTSLQIIDFVKVNVPMSNASPQTEASEKHENAVTFTTASERIRTIATWIPATKQILDDMTELMAFLQGSLAYYVDNVEEIQLLSGDNTGENLNGIIPQASTFDTGLLPAGAGWNYIDYIGYACSQIAAAKEMQPTFVCLHPSDWWTMRLTKDSYGRYILGDPMGPVNVQALFGLIPVPTVNITLGSFLVGSAAPAAIEIRDRQEITVEISTQHSDYFVRNQIALRAEKRIALLTKRPAAFITGSFSKSPA